MEDRKIERTALFVVCLSSFTTPLMLSSVNVAIPSIAAGLKVDAIAMSWLPTAFLLTSAVLLLPFGRLADMYGRKRVYISGMIIVTVGSVLASTSQSVAALIGYRVMQGVGSSMLFATGVAILSSVFSRERRGMAIGFSVSAIYLGLTCGPLIGGWATYHFSWRSVFLIHLPLAVLAIVIAIVKLRGEWKSEHPQRFDVTGSVLYAASIISLMYGVSILPSSSAFLLIFSGLAGIVIFMRYEDRTEFPLIDAHLMFTNRVFAFSCLAALMVYSSTFAISYLMSLYLQYILGMTPRLAGTILIAQPIIMALFSPLFGRLSDRREPRYIASAGMAVTSAGLFILSLLGAHATLVHIVGGLMLVGFGIALFSSPNINAIMGSVDKRHLGTASGASSTMRVLGQMFSMGIVTVVFAVLLGPVHITPEHFPALVRSVQVSFLVAACLPAAGIYLSMARGNVHG